MIESNWSNLIPIRVFMLDQNFDDFPLCKLTVSICVSVYAPIVHISVVISVYVSRVCVSVFVSILVSDSEVSVEVTIESSFVGVTIVRSRLVTGDTVKNNMICYSWFPTGFVFLPARCWSDLLNPNRPKIQFSLR